MKSKNYTLLCTAALIATPIFANAASFTINDGQTETTTQTLGPAAGETGTVNTGGRIATTGLNVRGINNTGNNATIINNGTITTTNTGSQAIRSDAANSTITNNGNITTQLSHGVHITDDDGVTNNNGSITTNGLINIGIWSTGLGSVVNNSGSVTTNGASSAGITGLQGNHTLNNSGTINTYGATSPGMHGSIGSSVVNTGSIITHAAGSVGISIFDNATAVNYGTITTNTAVSSGMQAGGINGRLDNYGTISSVGPGMRAAGTGNTLTNHGIITTSGGNSEGLIAAADNTTLINNGTITVTDLGADGIGSDSGTTGQTFVNNGVINVLGTSASGIANFSNGSTVTHNGVINTGGASTVAIYSGAANDTTLILGANSKTNGEIIFGGGTNELRYNIAASGKGGSVTTVAGAVTGAHTTSIVNTGSLVKGSKIVQQTNTVAVVTADSFAGTQQVVNQTVTQASNIIDRRQQAVVHGGTGVSSGDEAKNKTAWVEGFGSYQERPENGSADFSKATSGGALFGLDFLENNDGYKRGFYVGGFTANLEIGNSREIDSNGALVGGYVGTEFGNYYVNGQIAAGYSNNDSDRVIAGTTASADYNSYFISPSVNVMRPIKRESLTWVPSATLRYTGQYDGSYSEKGSVANQDVDSQYVNTLSGRAQIEARLNGTEIGSGLLKPSFRTGVEAQTLIGGRDVDVKVLGNNISFDPKGGDDYVDGIVGINLTYATTGALEIYADAEANLGLNKGGTDDNIGGTGRLGLKYKF